MQEYDKYAAYVDINNSSKKITIKIIVYTLFYYINIKIDIYIYGIKISLIDVGM